MTEKKAIILLHEHRLWLLDPPVVCGSGRVEAIAQAIQIGAKALAKQIPMEPKGSFPVYCQRCGKKLSPQRYCGNCGQRIKY